MIKLFLEKYFNLLKNIEATDAYCDNEFYDTIYSNFFDHITKYFNLAVYYTDETSGMHAVDGVNSLIKILKLPIEKFIVPNNPCLHIYYKRRN